jgi:hypothetical protein
MKTIGITCDNYKVDKFEQELTLKGYEDFEVFKLTETTKVIKVTVESAQFHFHAEQIRRLCVRLEHHFKRSN